MPAKAARHDDRGLFSVLQGSLRTSTSPTAAVNSKCYVHRNIFTCFVVGYNMSFGEQVNAWGCFHGIWSVDSMPVEENCTKPQREMWKDIW